MNVIPYLMLGLISLSPAVFAEMPGDFSPVSGPALIKKEIPANGERTLAGSEETTLSEPLSEFQEEFTNLPIIVAAMEDQDEDQDEGEDEGDEDEEGEDGSDEEEGEDTE